MIHKNRLIDFSLKGLQQCFSTQQDHGWSTLVQVTSCVPTWVLHVSSQEGVQHGPQQAGHASVHHDRPLGVGQVQVADQQQLCHEVGDAHHETTDEAGDEPNGSHSSVCSWEVNDRN